MREMKILCLTGLVGGVMLAAPSCNNFTNALDECIRENRCDVPPDGGDGGQPIERDGGCLDAGVDIPDDFDDINCDGIDGNRDEAIFVDREVSVSGDGTPESPMRTLAEALELARLSRDTKKAIYIADGQYTEENLNISFPISLYGNYGGIGSWTRSRIRQTTINGGTNGLGLTIRGVDAGVDAGVVVLIDRLTIRSATSTSPSAPSIAMRVVDSQGILLRNVSLVAGTGANGSAGTPGTSGSVGARGGDGSVGDATNPGSGGARGVGLVKSGGMGGKGGGSFDDQQDGGTGDSDTLGGTRGTRADVGNVSNCGTAAGGDGSNGAQGDTGTAGTAGNGIGALSGDTWVAHSGGVGGPGLSGNGGGGGGGGARCINTTTVPTTSASGGGGGGGGAAGTGGTGGAGGRGGEASIGLLLVRGQVRLEGGTVSGGQGGNGGLGGDGGAGGSGGGGGNGGNGQEVSNLMGTVVARGGKGGNGGRGGDGGQGGAGGGGGGGPSIGIWCDSPTTSSFINVGTNISAQSGGAGGSGGNSGSPGEAKPTHNCPP
jgi:hypothetical protein